MKNILVSDIMTRNPVTATPEITLFEAAKKMVKMRVGSLLLVNKKRLVGLVSQKDILWALIKKSQGDLSKIRAVDISPKKIATIRPSATLEEAIAKMKKTKFNRLPVILNEEFVVVITPRDILTFNPSFYPELEEFGKIREEEEKLKRIKKVREKVIEGVCEECGNMDILHRIDGMLICDSCASSR